MTERDKRELTDTEDELDQDQEAQLHYRGVAGRKDKERRTNTPMPLAAGGAGAGAGGAGAAAGAPGATAGAGMSNTATFTGAPAAIGGAALGAADAPQAAAADVRFTGDQLSADSVNGPGEDPWGAYDNPDNIPGLSLDEEDEESGNSDYRGMAMRGSGTRGGNSGGRMGPMMPMMGGAGGPGAAGAGAGAAALPGATVGGVGIAPNSVMPAQQAAAMQAAMTGAQQGSLPMSAMSSLNGLRATSAMTSPPHSGVMAAGSDGFSLHPDALEDTVRRLGMETDQPYVVGPDGQLYPNPYYTGGGLHGRGGGGGAMVPGINGGYFPKAADLDGDGVVSASEAQRWQAAQDRTGGGSMNDTGGLSGPSGNPMIPYGPGGGRDGIVGGLNSGGYQGTGSGGSSQHGSGGGGVRDTVGGLNSDGYSGSSYGGSSSTDVAGLLRDFGTATQVAKAIANGTGSHGGKKTFSSEAATEEAKDWDEVAEEQKKLATQLSSMPDPGPIFGVMDRAPISHRSVEKASVESQEQGHVASYNTEDGLQATAALMEKIENENITIGTGADK